MKTYLFTHTDLDGVGCAVLSTLAYPLAKEADTLDVAYVHYGNVNQVLSDFIGGAKDFTESVRVHITDMCPEGSTGKEICTELDKLNTEKKIKLFLCDHHDSSVWVKDYSWAWHDVRNEMCGTKLYMDFLRRAGKTFSKMADEFAECVCVYDNWLLDHPLRARSEGINRYLWFAGFDKFVHDLSHDPAADLSLVPAAVIQQLGKNEESYTKKIVDRQCVDNFVLTDRDNKKYCILIAEKNASQLCHLALNQFEELDYAVNLNPVYDKVELRSRLGPGGTNVGVIAEKMGGGGRQSTAGFMMSLKDVLKLALKGVL